MPSSSNIILPPIRTLFHNELFESIPPHYLRGPDASFPPVKQPQGSYMRPCQQLPLPTPHDFQRRSVSAASMSSVPSLTYSRSPTPSSLPHPSQVSSNHVRLVPCTLGRAELVVVAESDIPHTVSRSYITSRSGKRAVILTGPAIPQAIKAGWRVHPYRVDRR